MKAIGGYFELEFRQGNDYHQDAIRLNTGRNAFEYILRAKEYKKVYLPYYTCDVMLEPIQKLNLEVDFYHIDLVLKPVFDFSHLKSDEVFVYTNYFGICDKLVKEISGKCNNLIIDNAQAFFTRPLSGIDTFYSPRKFFGLTDGAYLYTDKFTNKKIDTDVSFRRFEHLIGRIDKGAEDFYQAFKENDAALSGHPIKEMSTLTQRMLQGIDYKLIAKIRKENFHFLHSKLKNSNELSINIFEKSVPMIYPFLIKNGATLKKWLIEQKIYIATYWPNVPLWLKKDTLELHLTNNLLALPIDQRYGISEMKSMLKSIEQNRNAAT